MMRVFKRGKGGEGCGVAGYRGGGGGLQLLTLITHQPHPGPTAPTPRRHRTFHAQLSVCCRLHHDYGHALAPPVPNRRRRLCLLLSFSLPSQALHLASLKVVSWNCPALVSPVSRPPSRPNSPGCPRLTARPPGSAPCRARSCSWSCPASSCQCPGRCRRIG